MALSAAAGVQDVAKTADAMNGVPPVADPRVRTYVAPTRIVWESRPVDGGSVRFAVEGAAKLMEPCRGQIPEAGLGSPATGCRLVNKGVAPGILIDFGRELHGGVQIGLGKGPRGMRLRVRFGESAAEAMGDVGTKGATNDHAVRDEVVEVPALGTRETGNTGFRFVRIDLATTGEVSLEFVRAVELARPMARLGSFRCSDERLNRIFETAVRTVQLCCQDYVWDGIKRDRLVWIGDLHPEEAVITSVFGAQPVVADSLDLLAAVTRPGEEMNRIGTYTLWWVRCLADWYRYTGDRAYLEKHADYLRATFADLARYVTPSNTFDGMKSVFLDWPTEHNAPAVRAGVQALALTAWRDAAFLADELGDEGFAGRCRDAAARLESQKGALDPNGSKQASALLALSGLREPKEMFSDVLGRDGVKGVSTFYGYYMLEAMSAAGEDMRALDTVRDYWGAMLDVGATSFWEDFNIDWTNNCFRIDELPVPGKKDIHGDYGEFCYSGFRHSLCHGWSAGPAAWLINHVLGLKPLDVGCRTVAVRPFLGDLDWAEGSLALPGGGSVSVRVEKAADGTLRTTATAPDWVKLVGDGIASAPPSAAVVVDFAAGQGPVKPLHGVDNSPVRVNGKRGQDEFKAAGIPYVRTHDAAGAWGGAHYVDIPNVFPDFDADETDPANYDFAFTDAYLKPLVEAGCRIFYRLGVTIENNWKIKAYNIRPPKDFAKWARICEHVVRHYNEGWANGFKWGIEYWEIWNEPENPPMWQGTREQFYEFYRVAANHLKTAFPDIKVGGYAGCGFYVVDDAKKRAESEFYRGFVTWFEDFCRYVQDPATKAPLDFFSWHLYVTPRWPVDRIATHAEYVRRTLDAAGLTATENIFNEWNVFRGPKEDQWDVLKTHVGAANVAAAFCVMQKSSIDKAMYYDALPTRCYCGLFDFPGERTTPCYEAFRAWNELVKCGESVVASARGEGVYAAAAKGEGRRAILIANVGDADAEVSVAGADGGPFTIYRIDSGHAKLSSDGTLRGSGAVRVPSGGIVLALSGATLEETSAAGSAAGSVNGIQQ